MMEEVYLEVSRQRNDAIIPHCLVCNDELGVSGYGAAHIFSDEVKTTHRQLPVGIVLSIIINRQLAVHSDMICKVCYNFIDEIDSIEKKLSNMKQALTNSYMKTLAEVKDKKKPSSFTLPSEFTPRPSRKHESKKQKEMDIQASNSGKGPKDLKVISKRSQVIVNDQKRNSSFASPSSIIPHPSSHKQESTKEQERNIQVSNIHNDNRDLTALRVPSKDNERTKEQEINLKASNIYNDTRDLKTLRVQSEVNEDFKNTIKEKVELTEKINNDISREEIFEDDKIVTVNKQCVILDSNIKDISVVLKRLTTKTIYAWSSSKKQKRRCRHPNKQIFNHFFVSSHYNSTGTDGEVSNKKPICKTLQIRGDYDDVGPWTLPTSRKGTKALQNELDKVAIFLALI